MSGVPTGGVRVEWTYEDYRLLPDDGNRYEVIDGDLFVTPAPTTTHQSVSKRIQMVLMRQVEEAGLGIVFNAPVDVIFTRTRTVQPDLVVVLAARRGIITERGIEGAPDLIVEITSPSTAASDRTVKRKLYASVGVVEYWIADPAAHTIEVLRLGPDGYEAAGAYGPGQRVASPLLPQIALPIDPVFAP